MSKTGPAMVVSEKFDFSEIESNELMLKMGIYYSTAIAQGESGKNTIGLFGPFPLPKIDNYISLVYSFFIKDRDADERYKGETYAFLVFILPKSLEQIFSNRFSISKAASDIISEYDNIDLLDLDFLKRIKNSILQIEIY